MKYEISKATAPAMPNLGKGTEIVKLLLSQASKDMYEPLVPMFFPIFGAHIFGAEFQYPDFSWKEPTGMMAQLVGNSGDNKGQLTDLVKAISRDFPLPYEGAYAQALYLLDHGFQPKPTHDESQLITARCMKRLGFETKKIRGVIKYLVTKVDPDLHNRENKENAKQFVPEIF